MTARDAVAQQSASSRMHGRDARPLYGRELELRRLFGLCDQLNSALGGAIVIRGDAGIGKSRLLETVASRAVERGYQVLSAVGVQAEAQLAFAGLHQLLSPMLDQVHRLPERQRAALLAAFGLSATATPEPFLIGLGTLELISDSAASTPLVIVVEDAHWLDEPTRAVLGFLARRLDTEPILMLLAERNGHSTPVGGPGVPELTLEGLDASSAAALLDDHAAGLGPPLRRRILEEAAGNPLALVELPTAFRIEDPGAEHDLGRPLVLTALLERTFAGQAHELPAATRSLLLVASADDSGLVGELLAAATILVGAAVTADALEPAVAARLLNVDGPTVRFRHPLVRSAIYQSATISSRQAAHSALADSFDSDPSRRIWHRAAATFGPDELVASQLDDMADGARRRGAVAIALAANERAADLSETSSQKGRRLLRAAEIAFELGHPEPGLRLLGRAEALDLTDRERTRLGWQRASHDDSGWFGGPHARSAVEDTEQMHIDGHVDLAWTFLLNLATRCWWENPDQATRTAVVEAAQNPHLPPNEPALLAVLAHADPTACGALVIDRISRATPETDPIANYLLGSAASAVWAYDLALRFLDLAVNGLRTQGRLGMLAQTLVAQTWAAVHLAREQLAVSAAAEAIRLARETNQPRWAMSAQLAQAAIAGERGDFALADALVADAEATLVPMGETSVLALAQFARGRAAVAHQHYAEGIDHHRRTLDPTDHAYNPYIGAWGLSDLVEAAAHTGQPELARAYLDQLESLATRTSGSLLRATAGYARTMVADDSDAEGLFTAALDIDLANWPCYRSRMLLWYGRWLRRQRRVAEARTPLREARQGFDALAFPALAAIARQELRATGETSRQRVPEAWDQLSPQELQVARMAADGLTNREIGERLYISHRTVGHHLHQMFPKLGITSRNQLDPGLLGLVGATT